MEDLNKRILWLEKRLAREKKARETLETIIEDKSRDLFVSYEYSQNILNSIGNLIIVTDENFLIEDINMSWGDTLSYLKGASLSSAFQLVKNEETLYSKIRSMDDYEDELSLLVSGGLIPVYMKGKKIQISNDCKYIFSLTDLSEMKKVEKESREMQERLINSAYSDGVAESAISVLHNIGNILTALNSRMSLKSELADFKKMSKLLNLFSNKWETMDKGKIEEIFSTVDTNFSKSLKDMDELYTFVSTKCAHIANIISSQQRYANMKENIRTKTNLEEVLDDCISIVGDRVKKRGISIHIVNSIEDLVLTEKVGLSQVILNLLVNSMESIDERIQTGESIPHSINVEFEDKDEQVLMKFKDTGMGLKKENLKELFRFGYSTKERGSGFGLHNCSNYMKANNGSIEIKSDGLCKGAEVLLTFEKIA